MPDAQHPDAVLMDILRVLERIERKLIRQDGRLDKVENPPAIGNGKNFKSSHKEDHVSSEDASILVTEGERLKFNMLHLPSAQSDPTSGVPAETHRPIGPILYSHWSLHQEDREADERRKETLQKYFGDYWKIPWDNRLPLRTIKASNHNAGSYWESQAVARNVSISAFEKNLASFSSFDKALKSHKGNDFLVIDYDLANNTRLYRLGEKAIGDELMVPSEGSGSAPWSRLM